MNLLHIRRLTLSFAVGISMVVLGLFYYWFAIADRYAVFIYDHLNATPFDATTSSRYWMAGLVAAAMVLLLNLLANWLLGQIALRRESSYLPPIWWQVWALCALPIAVGILLITMNVNRPTLPFTLALRCVVATWIGLALALIPGEIVARRPSDLFWLAWIGFGIVPTLLFARAIELPARGIIDPRVAYGLLFSSVAFGLVWTRLWLWVYSQRHQQMPPLYLILVSGLVWCYVVLPLVHYWLFTPFAYRYISTASNFFANSFGVQLLTIGLVVAILAFAYVPARWFAFVQLGRHHSRG